jgi:hypothetical protein
MYRVATKQSSKRPLVIAALAGVLVLAVLLTVLELTNTTLIFHAGNAAHTTPVSAGQTTKGAPKSGTSASSSPSQPQQNTPVTTEPGTAKNPTATGEDLVEPNGNFVSAHKNVPMDAPLSSVCNTSAGASCQIRFTSGSTTQTLPAQTADLGGTTYWNSWTPASIKLTPGTWKVQAVSTKNGQTKTSTDALNLEIAQ